MASLNQHSGALLRKLESIYKLSDDERAALTRLPMSIQKLPGRQDIVRDGDRPSRSCLVVEGFTFRYKMTSDGGRQIFSFHIPGEIPDLQSLHIGKMDHTLATLTPCKLGFIEHEDLERLIAEFPRIGAAFWRETLIDGSIFRLWMLNIGRKEADGRIAHFLCEMFERLKAVGLAVGDTCPLPITQIEIGDSLGLSTVHVNRTLQALRGLDLIGLSRSTLTIKNVSGLAKLADFDPSYLHQNPREAA